MDIGDKVSRFITAHALLPPGGRLVAAVSGGPDSLCLLDVLHGLGYQLIVVHLDHMLRPESGEEANYVRTIAQRYGLPVVIEALDVRAAAGEAGSLEEAAREARYEFLVRVAIREGVNIIATGHTADDQAETILMHFLRGAGPPGLRGMLPKTELSEWVGFAYAEGMALVRPLLGLARDETEAHCLGRGLIPVRDRSNEDLAFFRNRLRHELLPLLEDYAPGIRGGLQRMGTVMAATADFIAEHADQAWGRLVRSMGEGALTFESDAFDALHEALQRALLRKAIKHLQPGMRDIGFAATERGLEFMRQARRGQRCSITGGLELMHLGARVLLQRPDAHLSFPLYPQLPADACVELPIPSSVPLQHGWRLEVCSKQISPSERSRLMRAGEVWTAALDAALVQGTMEVRAPRPGERIQPLGMQGSKKLSELFIGRHIPQPLRALWPVVVMGKRVVCVVGLSMAHQFRLTEASEKAILLRLQPPSPD
jgi:tRNA(Ile)-lysidine synthase